MSRKWSVMRVLVEVEVDIVKIHKANNRPVIPSPH